MKKPPAKRSQPQNSEQQTHRHEISVQQHSWKAPLPPPSVLAEFNHVVENGAERIVRAWEVESEHRREIDRREQRLFYRDAIFSKSYALIFVLAALALSGWAVWMDEAWIGALLGSGTIASVVGSFIHQRKSR